MNCVWKWWWVFSRHYPFMVGGRTMRCCFFCSGWGDDPYSGAECPICYGQGFK